MQSSKPTAGHKSYSAGRASVLHLCTDLEPGDIARETVDLAIQTQRAGWRTLIASQGGLLVQEAERAAVRHTRMPLDREGLLVNWRNRVHLEALLQRERPSIVHAHGIEAVAHAIGLCRVHRTPLIPDLTRPIADHPRIHKLFKNLSEIVSVIRVPSNYMADQLQDIFHIDAEHIAVIPPGIDMRWYDPTSISPERLQSLSKLWRLPEQATVILVPMPLAPGNGHKEFLAALALLKRDDIFTVLVGDDRQSPGMREEIDALVSHHGLDGKVIMPEHCRDWPAACWLASIVVAPNTVPRGQAIELLAAQAIGRPVIITECGANPEMVLRGETAWVVPPDNIQILSDALREAINLHTTQRLDLAERTSQFIAETFPQISFFTNLMEVYEMVLRPTTRTVRSKAA